MRDKYKEIQINKPKVEFEDDGAIEVELEDVTEGAEVQEEIVQEQPKVETKPAEEDKKPSRAQKRIRQLHSEKQEMQARLAQAEREKEELLKQLKSNNTSSKTTLKERLETHISVLTTQLRNAIKEGDADLVVTLQDELINAKMELAGVKHELTSEPVHKEDESPKHKQPSKNQVPEKALEWIEDHPEFKTDPVFHGAAIALNNQLLMEGYDVESDDFYEELNTRLSKRFPEVFGIIEENGVELSKNKKSSGEGDSENEPSDVKNKIRTESPKARTEQIVSGSSRPSSAKPIQQGKKNSVTLTPADIKQAERWGLTLEQMARRMAHIESNKDGNGYTPIFTGKK